MIDFDRTRDLMVKDQIEARGVQDTQVLQAMRTVRREAFVPDDMRELSYRDSPLPIGSGQTISQPYIVGYMIEALQLQGGEKVLEIGGGSGYAAAVLAEIAQQVYTVERIDTLAEMAAKNLAQQGYDKVTVISGDGTTGWETVAPFDAILVSAGAPSIPESLKNQLAIGGRMVVPVGSHQNIQALIRITRRTHEQFDHEKLADVRFVPLIGEQGWEVETPSAQTSAPRVIQTRPITNNALPRLISENSDAFQSVEDANLDKLMMRIGDAQVVLIGEASHGTSEFYAMRARITQRLIEEKGFTIVAAEADWPDAARIDHYVRHRNTSPAEWTAFSRFPTWMWRNTETRDFVDWLHEHNKTLGKNQRTGFYGLDMYSLFTSINAVVEYLEELDPELAEVARWRYGCLSPWEADPTAYGRAALNDQYQDCENDVTQMLTELYQKRHAYLLNDGERFLDASQNAELIANAERYYRVMYYGSRASWNLRDQHMFDTLNRVIKARGEGAKAIVWAHNSHIGDASATEMAHRGEHNIGQLCRQAFGDAAYRIGFGTDHGTVAAASNWDQPMEIKTVQPAHPQSYEALFHQTQQAGLILPLRHNPNSQLIQQLSKPRLERAIGVIYRPETELASHYFEAVLPLQFDEYIWMDATRAVTPLTTEEISGMPETYPFDI